MCNLYANTLPQDAMRQLFRISPEQDHLGNADNLRAIFPRYTAPVVRLSDDGERELVPMHWGFLMPQKSKTTGKPIQPKAVNNARNDKVLVSSFWKGSFEERRCLVPATSFCEAKGRSPADYYWFSVTEIGQVIPFAFAGLWRQFRGHYKGEFVEIDTYTIVTTAPNELVEKIHPTRIPVILPPQRYEKWLTDRAEAERYMTPFSASSMTIIGHGETLKSEPVFQE